MDDSMIERVARAIMAASPGDVMPAFEPPWALFEKQALAAIEAMVEPTDAMTKAGVDELPNEGGISASAREAAMVWIAMVEAALVTTPSKL